MLRRGGTNGKVGRADMLSQLRKEQGEGDGVSLVRKGRHREIHSLADTGRWRNLHSWIGSVIILLETRRTLPWLR